MTRWISWTVIVCIVLAVVGLGKYASTAESLSRVKSNTSLLSSELQAGCYIGVFDASARVMLERLEYRKTEMVNGSSEVIRLCNSGAFRMRQRSIDGGIVVWLEYDNNRVATKRVRVGRDCSVYIVADMK